MLCLLSSNLPFKLAKWQFLYHQAPWCVKAQLPRAKSLSESIVVKGLPWW